jgi:hypothetical protein
VVLADWISSLRDLGVPTLLGLVLGAFITAWLQRKGRVDEHELTIQRLILQEQRAAASATDEALARLELRALHGPDTASDLRNEWITQVRPKALLIADDELARRIELIGQLLLIAHQAGQSSLWRHVAGTSIEDARDWLSAFLRRKPLMRPKMGTIEQINSGARQHGPDGVFMAMHTELLFRDEPQPPPRDKDGAATESSQ